MSDKTSKTPAAKPSKRPRKTPGAWLSIDPDNLAGMSVHSSELDALRAGQGTPARAVYLEFGTSIAAVLEQFRIADGGVR